MKEKLLVVLMFGGCLLGIWGMYKLLDLQDQRVYDYAVERCGGEDNLVPYHTQEGDTFYNCKVEIKK